MVPLLPTPSFLPNDLNLLTVSGNFLRKKMIWIVLEVGSSENKLELAMDKSVKLTFRGAEKSFRLLEQNCNQLK